MKSIKKWICILIITFGSFCAFAEMRLLMGGGVLCGISAYKYSDSYSHEITVAPSFTIPTILFGFSNESRVTPFIGGGIATALIVHFASVSTGISIELPTKGFFVQEIMFLTDLNYTFSFIMGFNDWWYFTFKVPYLFSFPSKKGFFFGFGPKAMYFHANHFNDFYFGLGIETFIGVRW